MNAGFIQYGDTPPVDQPPADDALAWLVGCQHPATVGWIFFGRWLFLDRSQDAEILADGRRLLTWIDSTLHGSPAGVDESVPELGRPL